MSHTPKHLRGLENVPLSPQDEREVMDLRTRLERVRRRVESEQEPGKEPWGFPFPREAARLFDALPSPFTVADAEAEGERRGLGAEDVADALRTLRAHELVSDGPEGFVKHPEAKSWF